MTQKNTTWSRARAQAVDFSACSQLMRDKLRKEMIRLVQGFHMLDRVVHRASRQSCLICTSFSCSEASQATGACDNRLCICYASEQQSIPTASTHAILVPIALYLFDSDLVAVAHAPPAKLPALLSHRYLNPQPFHVRTITFFSVWT